MTDANLLPYYPRFIFNCNDDLCFSTADLEEFKYLTEHKSDSKITRFVTGQKVDVKIDDENGAFVIKTYEVRKIDIHQIKYDLDEPTYGFNMNDCTNIQGNPKKHLMEIYVFLDLVK